MHSSSYWLSVVEHQLMGVNGCVSRVTNTGVTAQTLNHAKMDERPDGWGRRDYTAANDRCDPGPGRRETWFVTTLAVLLVLVRAAVFILHGYVDFDSDQAIVGLMAKHLSEFRTFPLFYYGQNYMLGVQSWIIAPLFWIARPSIGVQKIPLMIVNVVTAVVLVRLLISNLRLRPALAFRRAAVQPDADHRRQLPQSVEPLLRHPHPVGCAIGPWLLAIRVRFPAARVHDLQCPRSRSLSSPAGVVNRKTGCGPFWCRRIHAVWPIIDRAKVFLSGTSLILQAQQLSNLACVDHGPSVLERTRYVFTTIWPILTGGIEMPLAYYPIRSSSVVGSALIGWTVGATLILMVARLAWLWRFGHRDSSFAFAGYLALVGCCAIAAYGLTCAYAFPVIRSFTLGVFLPIGCVAAFLAWDTSAPVRTAGILILSLWGAANLADNVRVLRDAFVTPEPDPHAELTEFLLSHRIRYARGSYWDSYIVDFLSRERVIVGSSGPVRIPEYERLVDEYRDSAAHIERLPCKGQLYVSAWCIQLPDKRPAGGAR